MGWAKTEIVCRGRVLEVSKPLPSPLKKINHTRLQVGIPIQFNSTKYIFTTLQHLHEKHSMQSCTHEKRTKEARKSFISSPLFLHMKPTSRDCTGSFSYHLPRRSTPVPDCWSRAHSAFMGYFFLSITLKKVNLYNMIRYNTMHCNDFVYTAKVYD